jgi:hypothetical protein
MDLNLVLNRLLTAIPYFPNENVYNEEYVNIRDSARAL